MRLADQLRTTTFLLTFRYMVLFFVSVTILFIFVNWSATGFLEQETEAAIDTDVAGLKEQFDQRGPKALARTVAMRVSTDPNGDAVYLIADEDLNPLIGNISKLATTDPHLRWLGRIRCARGKRGTGTGARPGHGAAAGYATRRRPKDQFAESTRKIIRPDTILGPGDHTGTGNGHRPADEQ